MQDSTMMWLRDPHWFLNQYILEMGFDNQDDQPLLDKVNLLTRDQALLVFHVLDARLQNSISVNNDELKGLILDMSPEKILQEVQPRILH